MAFRLFIKGEGVVVVDTLAEARKLMKISVPHVKKSDNIDAERPESGLPGTAKYADDLDTGVSETSEPVEITLTEKDFLSTLSDVNIIRGKTIPPTKADFSSSKKVK